MFPLAAVIIPVNELILEAPERDSTRALEKISNVC